MHGMTRRQSIQALSWALAAPALPWRVALVQQPFQFGYAATWGGNDRQACDVPNLFVTDGACMTSSSNQNPSLTYMALTARACHYAMEEMRRGNL